MKTKKNNRWISKQLFLKAKKLVLSRNKFSIGFLQASFELGYYRAKDLFLMIERSTKAHDKRPKRLVSKNTRRTKNVR